MGNKNFSPCPPHPQSPIPSPQSPVPHPQPPTAMRGENPLVTNKFSCENHFLDILTDSKILLNPPTAIYFACGMADFYCGLHESLTDSLRKLNLKLLKF